jgi:ferric-dicitrate binding protein FerR (iron transport regulator)
MERIGLNQEKIQRYFNGSYSAEDESYVKEVFGDKHIEKELNGVLSEQFNELLPEVDLDVNNLDQILCRIHYEINTQLPDRNVWTLDNVIKWTLRIAGVLMLPLVIFIAINTFNRSYMIKEAWVEIKAPAWTKAQFSLPDGTTGWLNSNSSVKYNRNFTSDRIITLEGEAFFDVAEDKRRPFKVNTKDINVEVLGTRFNIASYENEKNIEVVLEEGKLLFNDTDRGKSLIMNPNELLVYDKNLLDFSTQVIQPQKYISWTEGKLVFRNDPIDEIAKRLERWYNIDVEVVGSSNEDLRLRATFINEGLEEVLDLLKRSLPIDYNIKNGELKPDEIYAKKKVIITLKTK